MHWNGKVELQTQRSQKYALYQKNVLNESCSELNFAQKTQRAHMLFLYRGELGGSKN